MLVIFYSATHLQTLHFAYVYPNIKPIFAMIKVRGEYQTLRQLLVVWGPDIQDQGKMFWAAKSSQTPAGTFIICPVAEALAWISTAGWMSRCI